MAFVLSDRIKETTTTTGTGTYTLGGAVSGFETFTANLSNSDTTYYCCTDGSDFEVGLGTFASSGTTLARTTIISSSNSNNAVSWSSGSREIFCTLPGSKAVFKDGSDNINGTFVGNITGNVTGNASGTAATVTGAAQSNITSVGTLTGLTTSGTINLSQLTGTAIKTTGNLDSRDLGILRAAASGDSHGFTIKYMGTRTGNNNSYSLFMDNQSGTDVEAMTVLQDGKVGINNTSPSAPLDVSGDAEITGTLTAGEVSATTLDIGGTNITSTATEINKLDGVTATTTELNYVDVTTLGTVEASKAVTADSGADVTFPSGSQIFTTSDGSNAVMSVRGNGPNFIEFLDGTGTADGVQIAYRTTPHDLRIERRHNDHIIAEFGGDDGHAALYHANSIKLETTSGGVDVTGDLTAITSDGAILSLQTSDTTVADGDTIGLIEFKAPSEASGTDAILTAASIAAEADATFAADNNQTDMVFNLGSSEAATEKMRLSHEGILTVDDGVVGSHFGGINANSTAKFRYWNSSSIYVSGFTSGYTFGGLGDSGNDGYSINWTNSNTDGRGFIWDDSGHSNSQGAMALTTNGKLTVAHSIRVGHGESDTTTPGATHVLDVGGSGIINGDLTATTSDGAILKLQTSDTTVADGDVVGAIEFSAPDEAGGTDAITTAAAIVAEADATFAADNNQTDMVFKLGSSEAATEKMRLTHEGNLSLTGNLTVNGGQIISEDGFIGFGDESGDNWGKVEYLSSNPTGFTAQFNNAVALDNEQGSANQQIFVLDTSVGNTNDLFGISSQDQAVLSVTGQGNIIFKRPNDNTTHDITLACPTPTAARTVTLPDATGTVLTTGNSATPTTTTSSSDADFVLVDDGGTMKKITPANLGVGGGLLVSLANDTSGATTSALEIDLSTSTDYAYQMLVLRGFDSSTSANLQMQLRKDSDDSYITDSYLSVIGSHLQTSSSTSSGQSGLWNGSHFLMVNNSVTTDGAHQLNDMKIYFFNTATDKKAVVGADRFGQNSSGVIKEQMAGKSGYADVNDRFKLFMSSGNLVYDEYTLYGFKKA